MKKIILFSLAVVFLMTNCKKEGSNVQLNHHSLPNVKLITLSDGTRTSLTMLEFTDSCSFDAILDSLDARMRYLDDAFVAQYPSLNDSLLNAKEVEIGFNYQQPLIYFENYLSFTNSMRQVFVEEEEDWLNHSTLNINNDPAHNYVFRLVEMTLLNADGEVKVGNSLIKVTKDGFVEFTDGSLTNLIRFNQGDTTVLYERNVVTNLIELSRSSNCKSWKGEDVWDEYDPGKKKVKLHVHFHSWPWKGTGQAEITSYKKSGSRWDKYRMDLGVANESVFYDNDDCSTIKKQGWTDWKRKKAKSIDQSFSDWGAFPCYRAKNNYSITGEYEYAQNYSYEVLSW